VLDVLDGDGDILESRGEGEEGTEVGRGGFVLCNKHTLLDGQCGHLDNTLTVCQLACFAVVP